MCLTSLPGGSDCYIGEFENLSLVLWACTLEVRVRISGLQMFRGRELRKHLFEVGRASMSRIHRLYSGGYRTWFKGRKGTVSSTHEVQASLLAPSPHWFTQSLQQPYGVVLLSFLFADEETEGSKVYCRSQSWPVAERREGISHAGVQSSWPFCFAALCSHSPSLCFSVLLGKWDLCMD